MSLLVNLSILESHDITLQSWARDIFFSLATTTKRRYRVHVTRKKSENIQAAVSKWSSHKPTTKTSVLSRAQLCGKL